MKIAHNMYNQKEYMYTEQYMFVNLHDLLGKVNPMPSAKKLGVRY